MPLHHLAPSQRSPGGLVVVAGITSLALALLSSCGKTPVNTDLGPVEAEASPAPAAPLKPGPTGIQPGETLDVFVMEDDSFSGRYQVRSTGHIIIPKVGRVKVEGLSAAGAEKQLARELEKNKLKSATVLVDRAIPATKPERLGKPTGTEVFLSGKVSRPGRYTITAIGNSPPTVHQAILQAGGCSRFAHKKKAHVLRRIEDGRLQRIDADLLAIESGQTRDVPLASGDIVVVPEKKVDFGL